MKNNKNLLILIAGMTVITIAVVLLLILISFLRPTTTNVEVPPAGTIEISGTMVCLPHKNTDGPQTLECAFGLLDSTGRYFALQDTDPNYSNVAGIPMGAKVDVSGKFTPQASTIYKSIGTIEVVEINIADVPVRKTLTGTYVCLPHKDTDGPQTDECAFGLKTADGKHYAVDFTLVSGDVPTLQVGDKMKASGLVVPLEQLSTNYWQKYDIEGIFSVTDSVTKI